MNLPVILVLIIITLAENVNSQESPWNCRFDVMDIPLDFSKLYKDDDYIIHHESKDETFRIQFCGALHKSCNGIDGYSACIEFGNKTEIGLGRIPEHSYEDGRIMYKYTGDKCKDANYQLHIIMMCDYGAIDSYPELFPYERNYCTYFIIWRTILACLRYPSQPIPSISCNISEKNGSIYDLSDLTRLDHNYEVFIDKNKSIILNVCHPVVYGYRAVCLDDAAACLRNNTENVSYKSLGSINSMKLHANPLTLEYEMGGLCLSAVLHSHISITFVCDYTAINTAPVFVEVENECHYKLNWRTAAACNKKDLEEYSRNTAEPCKITNPVTKTNYDLNSLKGKEPIVKTKTGLEYKFSICKPLLSNACGTSEEAKNAGVCSASTHTISGKANSKLLWSVKGPFLNYTDGTSCGEKKNRATQITFVCAPEGAENMNTINDDDPCNFRILYHTSLVCEEKNILCSDGFVLLENGLCTNGTSSYTSDSKITFIANLISAFMLMCGLLLLIIPIGCSLTTRVQRKYFKSLCCPWYYPKYHPPMQYSRINTDEETNVLLDASDTHCQSDSDDDLLAI